MKILDARRAGAALFMIGFAASFIRLGAQERVMRQTVDFSGYVWNIRQSEDPGGPLDNRFAGRDRSVILRQDGALELRASYEGGLWYAAEVSTVKRLGYGVYTFRIRTDLSGLDRNLVLGLFTYSRSAADNHSEIDIEFSSWGDARNPPQGQYVVQPYDKEGHMLRFGLSGLGERSSFRITWRADRVEFSS
ncbi:MAG TPA: glycoside hydrolase family 16 protein, partial [Rectinemataceae bacterium]